MLVTVREIWYNSASISSLYFRMQLFSSPRRGFTLIELLIVVVIIGILAVGLVPKVLDAPKRARDTVRMSDLKNIRIALQSYAADHAGAYPVETNPTKIDTLDVKDDIAGYFDSKKIPMDPKNFSYFYKKSTQGGTCYIIGSQLETTSGNVDKSFENSVPSTPDGGFLGSVNCDSDTKDQPDVADGKASNYYAMIVRY